MNGFMLKSQENTMTTRAPTLVTASFILACGVIAASAQQNPAGSIMQRPAQTQEPQALDQEGSTTTRQGGMMGCGMAGRGMMGEGMMGHGMMREGMMGRGMMGSRMMGMSPLAMRLIFA